MNESHGLRICQKLVGKTACGLTEKDLIHHMARARAQGFDEEMFPDADFHDFVEAEKESK